MIIIKQASNLSAFQPFKTPDEKPPNNPCLRKPSVNPLLLFWSTPCLIHPKPFKLRLPPWCWYSGQFVESRTLSLNSQMLLVIWGKLDMRLVLCMILTCYSCLCWIVILLEGLEPLLQLSSADSLWDYSDFGLVLMLRFIGQLRVVLLVIILPLCLRLL